MSYRDYEAVYVKKTQTLEQWQKATVKAVKSSKSTQGLTPQPKGAINCKDFAELQNYWATNYGVKVFDSMVNIDFQAFREISRGVESVIREFPKVRKTLKGFDADDVENPMSYIETIYESYMNFNRDILNDYPKLVKSVAEDVKYRHHPKNMGVIGLGAHEMGHILERALINKYGGGIPEWGNMKYTENLIREAVAVVQSMPEGKIAITDYKGKTSIRKVSITQLRKRISDYAGENYSETLAEAVCDYMTNGENANLLSKEIWKVLKRELD